MTNDDVRDVIQDGESAQVEFKRSQASAPVRDGSSARSRAHPLGDVQSVSLPAHAGSGGPMNVQWLRNATNLGSRVAVTGQGSDPYRAVFSHPTNKTYSTPGMPTRKERPDTADRHETARIVEAEVNQDELTVHLEDGRSVTTPLEWYPRLAFATSEERQNFEITGRGRGLHWPMLDEDLSVNGMLSGTSSAEGAQSLKGWKEALKERRRLRNQGEEPPPWGTGKYRIPYSDFLDDADDNSQ